MHDYLFDLGYAMRPSASAFTASMQRRPITIDAIPRMSPQSNPIPVKVVLSNHE